VRARVSLGHPEIGEQERDRLGSHRRPAIGVDGELPALDALPRMALVDELLGQRGALPMGRARTVACSSGLSDRKERTRDAGVLWGRRRL
jgi:hypothetical protein